jgi:phage shock protein C
MLMKLLLNLFTDKFEKLKTNINMNKKLYRDEHHKVFGGVCSGLADYFDMDVTVVRLLFAFTFFIMGVGFVPYIILWIVLPRKDYNFPGYNNPTVDYRVPPRQTGEAFNQPPYQSGSAFSNNPYGFSGPVNFPPKQKSNAGIIAGLVLIIIGGAILADEYDLIPFFDWDRLWPVVLVIVGGALIASGQKKHPWQERNWSNNTPPEDTQNDNGPKPTDQTTTL